MKLVTLADKQVNLFLSLLFSSWMPEGHFSFQICPQILSFHRNSSFHFTDFLFLCFEGKTLFRVCIDVKDCLCPG